MRRRRLLGDSAGDELDGDEPIRADRSHHASPEPTVRYADAARIDLDRRLHDLFPSGYPMLALVTICGLALVALLVVLDVWSSAMARVLSAEEVAALQLTGSRNLSHWLASTILALCGALALFTYSLRRHRVDDYHGRYRVWIWMSLACWMGSLGETTDVGHVVRGVCRRLADYSGASDYTLWYALGFLLLVGFGIRLAIEMRRCRLAVLALKCSLAAMVLSSTVRHGWLFDLGPNKQLAARGIALCGYVFLLSSLLSYLRYVTLEMQGKVTHRVRKRMKSKHTAEHQHAAADHPSKPALHVRIDLEPAEDEGEPAAAHLHVRGAKGEVTSSGTSIAADESAGRAMTRAERKRARRQARLAG